MMTPSASLRSLLAQVEPALRAEIGPTIQGHVLSISGMELRATGLRFAASIGDHVVVDGHLRGEIVGIRPDAVQILPFGSWEGVAAGAPVRLIQGGRHIQPDLSWLGRVVDPFG